MTGPLTSSDMTALDDARGGTLTRRALLAVPLVMGAAGCGVLTPDPDPDDGTEPLELTAAPEIDEAIDALWNNGGERALSEITQIQFDDLMVFPEGTSAERVNEAAGGKLLNGKYYHSSTQLFLFRPGGRGVLAAMVSADVFEHEVQNATFGPEVRIVAPGDQQLVTLED